MKKVLMLLMVFSVMPLNYSTATKSNVYNSYASLEASSLNNVVINQSDVGQAAASVWETIKALLGGPIGKAIALILIVGGIIGMALGQLQWGLIAFVAGALLAAAPTIIDTLFK